MKVVINRCFGGFGVSDAVLARIGQKYDWELDRSDPALIAAIEEVGLEASASRFAELEIVEVPDSATDWRIDDYDGMESITCVVDGKLVDL